jgi:hypothetical protein
MKLHARNAARPVSRNDPSTPSAVVPPAHPADTVRPKSVGEAVNDLFRHDEARARLDPGRLVAVQRDQHLARAVGMRIRRLLDYVQRHGVQVEVDGHRSPSRLLARRQPVAQPLLLVADLLQAILQPIHGPFQVGDLSGHAVERRVEPRRPHFLLSEPLVEIFEALPMPVPVVCGKPAAWTSEGFQVGA